MHTSRITRITAVALAAAALGASSASASPAPEPGGNKVASPPPASREIDKSLDWGSAALGAGGAASVLLLTGAGATALNRRRHRVGVVT